MEQRATCKCQRPRGYLGAAAALALLLGLLGSARAELQFDVFVGYGLGANEGAVAEGRWFPVVCEVYNDGPAFDGIIELSTGSGQKHRAFVELPTGTRKRVLLTCFAGGRFVSLEAQLQDAKGRVRAARSRVQARQVTDRQSPLIGSLSRTLSGAASLPQPPPRAANQMRPAVARLSVELLPDNTIALDGLSSLSLHSSKAVELKAPQVTALLGWLRSGGHLILSVEQPGDIAGAPWLAGLLPCEVTGVTNRLEHAALQSWINADPRTPSLPQPASVIRRPGVAVGTPPPPPLAALPGEISSANPFAGLQADEDFEKTPMPTASVRLRDGRVLLGSPAAPLALQCSRGRGMLTVLLFSPDLEPFRSWKNRSWFWARLTDVPIEWLAGWNAPRTGGCHVDGLFGAMADSRQIRKLPVTWLFVLLLIYLAVIGPVDQYVLKRINKQMLTWVTFPLYVAFFSMLIYYIGYKLRAGEAEWNEFQVVDVIPHGERADFRGRSYGSIYSPVNAEYGVACEAPHAALRGELSYYGEQEISKATVEVQGNSFKAQLNAPIWTSQLFLADWWRQGTPPLQARIRETADSETRLEIENPGNLKIPEARLVVHGRVRDLGPLSRKGTFVLPRSGGQALADFVADNRRGFSEAINARRSHWAGRTEAVIRDYFAAACTASFLRDDPGERSAYPPYQSDFLAPPGFNLGSDVERGQAVLLIWLPDQTILPPLNRFSPRRTHQWTMVRIIVPVEAADPTKTGGNTSL